MAQDSCPSLKGDLESHSPWGPPKKQKGGNPPTPSSATRGTKGLTLSKKKSKGEEKAVNVLYQKGFETKHSQDKKSKGEKGTSRRRSVPMRKGKGEINRSRHCREKKYEVYSSSLRGRSGFGQSEPEREEKGRGVPIEKR